MLSGVMWMPREVHVDENLESHARENDRAIRTKGSPPRSKRFYEDLAGNAGRARTSPGQFTEPRERIDNTRVQDCKTVTDVQRADARKFKIEIVDEDSADFETVDFAFARADPGFRAAHVYRVKFESGGSALWIEDVLEEISREDWNWSAFDAICHTCADLL